MGFIKTGCNNILSAVIKLNVIKVSACILDFFVKPKTRFNEVLA